MATSGKKLCAYCGEIITGRSDKRYCSSHCRFMQHREMRRKMEEPVIRMNKILRKNRGILKSLCPKGKATVRREVLEAMGYDFTMFCSAFTTTRGVYYICYEYAFTPVLDKSEEKALIVSRQSYMGRNDPWRYLKEDLPIEDLKYFL